MRVLFSLFGALFFALGVIGAFLPVLPSAPFLLLASGCFAKSSVRFGSWLQGTKLYRKHLRELAQTGSMTLAGKLKILIPVTVMMTAAFILADIKAARIAIGAALLIKYCVFFFRIKTKPARKAVYIPPQGKEYGRNTETEEYNGSE
jgi:uncharacterized membrane protein YbaN (DUF454 family)